MRVTRHPCDVCGQDAPLDIPALEHYGLRGQIVVCSSCGFVYVPVRRSSQEIADSWSHEIFGSGYTSDVPYVKARLYWVAQELSHVMDLQGKTIVDVGAGEGELLSNLRALAPSSRLIGVDPSQRNVDALLHAGFEAYCGTAQELVGTRTLEGAADLVTLTWTLENTNDCREVVESCRLLLRPGGSLAIATGSRILVPFKKPLSDYLTSERPPDTHAFRFSRRSLGNLLESAGFTVEWENQWADSDWMMLVSRAPSGSGFVSSSLKPTNCDSATSVIDFFSEWHRHTEMIESWVAQH